MHLQQLWPANNDSCQEVMLIGESCDAQSICLCATGNACPIDLQRDVGVTNLLKGRVEMSMAGANLNISRKFIARFTVIDGDDVAALQVRGDGVDPVECRLIKGNFATQRLGSRRSLRERALDEHKLTVLNIDELFDAGADQAHWQGVEQFVRKMDADKWFK